VEFLGAQNDFSQSEEQMCSTAGDPEQISDPHDHAEVKEKVKCNTASPWNNVPEHTFTLQEEFKTQKL